MARIGKRIHLASVLNETPEAQREGVQFDEDEYILATSFRMVSAELWDELWAHYQLPEEKITKEALENYRRLRAQRASVVIREWCLTDPETGEKYPQPHGNTELFMSMYPTLLSLLERAISIVYDTPEAKQESVGEE